MFSQLRKMSTIAPAKIVSQKSHIVSGKLKVTEHFFDVPKDYSKPAGGTLRVFARSVEKHNKPIIPEDATKDPKDKDLKPWMCYLQGGPGFRSPPPQNANWTHTILDKGYRMLYLDQRGTGLSTPLTASTLQMRGDSDVQASYLKLFRADSIVRDCEAIRSALALEDGVQGAEDEGAVSDKAKWSIMGQSFGGFCAVTYLSFFPAGLREVFLFGGLMPLVREPDEVYRRLYACVQQRNEAYYEKYAEDGERVRQIMEFLARFGDGTIRLPSEGRLTQRRFAQLGLAFGGHGGFDTIHDIVLRSSNDISLFGHLTRGSLSAIDAALPFDDALLYAILHEPIYCQGRAPNWSAQRLLAEFPAFDPALTVPASGPHPPYFTGEMVYPWMFSAYSELAKVEDVANRIAADADWPDLVDEAQLARNTVPVYAAAYLDDMYVEFDLSMATARAIKGTKVFATNVLFHDAIRSRMDEVLRQVFALREDVVD